MEITFNFGAPQIIMVAIYIINTIYDIIHHGESRVNEKYNAWTAIIGAVIGIAILTWGGFF